MKKVVFNSIFVIFILFVTVACSSTKVTTEEIAQNTEMVQNNDFTIDVYSANPLRGKTVNLSYGYSIRIHNDSAYAFLPYFGVARIAPIGLESEIKFADKMTNFTMKSNKKQTGWDIRFKTRSGVTGYDVFLNVFDNGTASISITPDSKDQISFIGRLKNK